MAKRTRPARSWKAVAPGDYVVQIGEFVAVFLCFEVKIQRIRALGDFVRQGCLADLPGAYERHGSLPVQGIPNLVQCQPR